MLNDLTNKQTDKLNCSENRQVQRTFSAAYLELSREAHTSLTPATSSSSSVGTLRCSQAPGTPPGRRCSKYLPEEVPRRQFRCLNHLNWLLLMWKSSGSTPSPSRLAKLLNLSLRESPTTLWRKQFCASHWYLPTSCTRKLWKTWSFWV